MVLFTHKKLILKGSKKQYQILAQTAYYQAGKIVVQTILPEQPPVALITLNTFGTTCSTSADTYIPIENISNTQSCFFLESRLVSLYGGKAASLLIEYHQRFTSFYPHDQSATLGKSSTGNPSYAKQSSWQGKKGAFTPVPASQAQLSGLAYTKRSKQRRDKGSLSLQVRRSATALLEKQRRGEESETGITYNTEIKLIDNVQNRVFDTSDFTLFQNKKLRAKSKAPLVKTYFAGAGNNPFQSTLGNIEIQTATRLAKIMVNYWNFYLLNKNSLYSLFKRDAHPHYLPSIHIASQSRRFPKGSHAALLHLAERGRARRLATRYPSASQVQYKRSSTPYLEGVKGYGGVLQNRGLPFTSKALHIPRRGNTHANSLSRPASTAESVVGKGIQDMRSKEAEGYTKHKSVCSIKLQVKDQTFQGKIIYRVENNFYLAIAQSKNSLKICENKNSSYNIQRLSVENIGNYSQLNTNNFQLINSLQFSNLQRDHFYPNWFRLYLPDIEASEFLKNVANYYFSLGLQTLTLPSTKSSPFLTFLNKNPRREKYKLFIPNILSCTYCPPSILVNSTSDKSINPSAPLPLTGYAHAFLRAYPVRGKGAGAELPSDYYTFYPHFAKGLQSLILQGTPIPDSQAPYQPALQAKFVQQGKPFQEIAKRGSKEGLAPALRYSLPLYPRPRRDKGVWSKAYAKQSSWGYSFASKGVMEIKDPSFIKIAKNDVPFSLLLENQIFPLNCNGFSIVEKELLYNALINSCFAKAFHLINQNRQMLDFFVDYLLRFQILRQHQILYLFSTLLLGCYKRV